MRIGTWNVDYVFKHRLDILRRVLSLRDNQADIWVLTETHDELVPPGCEHVAHSEPRPKNFSAIRPGSRWVSIWSRFPIIEQVSLRARIKSGRPAPFSPSAKAGRLRSMAR